jgi:hypothetical protein
MGVVAEILASLGKAKGHAGQAPITGILSTIGSAISSAGAIGATNHKRSVEDKKEPEALTPGRFVRNNR